MNIQFHKDFKKQYKRLPAKLQSQFDDRLMILMSDPDHPLLNLHPLKGEQWPLVSMNVSGDCRALFIKEKTHITFYKIGTHSELYS